MTASEKREAALALLAKTGIWPSNYAPPAFHVLWRLGVNVPPPHFIGFFTIVIFTGGLFGALMTLFLAPTLDLSFHGALLYAASTGGAFGLAMACYYAYGRRRHDLPRWSELGPASGPGTRSE